MSLAGKKVVVVGGSSGIGLATAEMAKREGAEIIIASRNVEKLDKAAEKLNAIAIPADVTSDDSAYRTCSARWHSMSKRRAKGCVPARFLGLRMYFLRSTPSTFWDVVDPIPTIFTDESRDNARARYRNWAGKLL